MHLELCATHKHPVLKWLRECHWMGGHWFSVRIKTKYGRISTSWIPQEFQGYVSVSFAPIQQKADQYWMQDEWWCMSMSSASLHIIVPSARFATINVDRFIDSMTRILTGISCSVQFVEILPRFVLTLALKQQIPNLWSLHSHFKTRFLGTTQSPKRSMLPLAVADILFSSSSRGLQSSSSACYAFLHWQLTSHWFYLCGFHLSWNRGVTVSEQNITPCFLCVYHTAWGNKGEAEFEQIDRVNFSFSLSHFASSNSSVLFCY